MKRILLFFFLILSVASYAQQDSLIKIDLTTNKNSAEYPDSFFTFNIHNPIPKRSALYSAILPGWGQVYNKQYWKLGLVAGGAGVATGFIIFNNNQYQKYRNAYIARIDNDPTTVDEFVGLYQNEDLNSLQKEYRQYLEYTVVFTFVGYTLNILDAYVGANLKSFDITDDISMQVRPSISNGQIGMALILKPK